MLVWNEKWKVEEKMGSQTTIVLYPNLCYNGPCCSEVQCICILDSYINFWSPLVNVYDDISSYIIFYLPLYSGFSLEGDLGDKSLPKLVDFSLFWTEGEV